MSTTNIERGIGPERSNSRAHITVPLIHEILRGIVYEDRPPHELTEALHNQHIVLPKEVWNELDTAFTFEHELSFTFYAHSQNPNTIAVIRDHTDYARYHQSQHKFVAHREDNRYRQDTTTLIAQGFVVSGDYHTHPVDKAWVASERRRFKKKVWKGPERILWKPSLPSSGDIAAWVDDETRNNFIFIGHKTNAGGKLLVRAFVPILSFNRFPGRNSSGISAIKGATNCFTPEAKIDQTELDLYWKLPSGDILQINTLDKATLVSTTDLVIEIPVKIS